jgi:hypothetical protein
MTCSTSGYTGAVAFVGGDAANPGAVAGLSLFCGSTSVLQAVGNTTSTVSRQLAFSCPSGQRIISVSGFASAGVVQGVFFTCAWGSVSSFLNFRGVALTYCGSSACGGHDYVALSTSQVRAHAAMRAG